MIMWWIGQGQEILLAGCSDGSAPVAGGDHRRAGGVCGGDCGGVVAGEAEGAISVIALPAGVLSVRSVPGSILPLRTLAGGVMLSVE